MFSKRISTTSRLYRMAQGDDETRNFDTGAGVAGALLWQGILGSVITLACILMLAQAVAQILNAIPGGATHDPFTWFVARAHDALEPICTKDTGIIATLSGLASWTVLRSLRTDRD